MATSITALDCAKLTVGIVAADCNKSVAAGINGEVIFINFDDIDRENSDLQGNVITAIVLKSGKIGYKFETLPGSAVSNDVELKNGKYRSEADDKVTPRIFKKNQLVKNFIESAKYPAKFVIITKSNEGGDAGEVQYEAHGWDCGLQMSSMKGTSEMADGVAYEPVFSFIDSKESGLPKSIFITDIATTKTMIDALTVNTAG